MPNLPKELQLAEWNKNKGKAAKMKGKTGISAALKKLKTDFDNVPWDQLNVEKVDRGKGLRTSKDYEEDLLKMMNIYDKEVLGTLCKSLRSYQTLAEKVAKEFKAAKWVGKGTRQYVESMAKAAGQLHKHLAGPFLKTFRDPMEQKRKARLQGEKIAIEDLKKIVNALPAKWTICEKGIKDAENDQDKVKIYNKFYMEHGPNTIAGDLKVYHAMVCPNDPIMAKHVKVWNVLGDRAKKQATEASQIETLSKQWRPAFAALVTVLKKRKAL